MHIAMQRVGAKRSSAEYTKCKRTLTQGSPQIDQPDKSFAIDCLAEAVTRPWVTLSAAASGGSQQG